METEEGPLSKENLMSGVGLDCMLCSTPIDDGEFCSAICEDIYTEVHKND